MDFKVRRRSVSLDKPRSPTADQVCGKATRGIAPGAHVFEPLHLTPDLCDADRFVFNVHKLLAASPERTRSSCKGHGRQRGR